MAKQIEIGDFVEDLSFAPSTCGTVVRQDDKRPNGYIVAFKSGVERSISARNLRKVEAA